jgi:hypothetical protein
MFPAGSAHKLLQWELEFSPARKPGAVDSIAGPIEIAAPDALQTKQNIALQMRPNELQLISKPDYRRRPQPLYRSKWPLVLGPFVGGHKLDLMAGSYDSICKSFEVRFCAAAPRITSAHKRDSEFLIHCDFHSPN